MKVITQSIQNGISFAYISLLQDCMNLLTNPLSLSIGTIDKDLEGILQDTQIIFSSLDFLMGDDEKSRNECIQKLQSHHRTLEKKYKVLNGYSRELNHIAIHLEEEFHLKTTPLSSIEGINYHQFIHETLDFISQAKTPKEKNYKLQEILRFIPMRMTKDTFIAYIKNSLEKVSPGKSESSNLLFLSIFKQLFDGRFTPDYHEVFNDLAIAIESIRKTSQRDLQANDIEETFDDIYLLKDTIEELYTMLVLLHGTISNISVLLLLDNLSFDLLCNEHIAFKDLFLTLKSLISGDTHGEDYTILLETLPPRLEGIYNEIEENYQLSFHHLRDNIKKGSLSQTNETMKSIALFNLIHSYFLLDIGDAFAFNEKTEDDVPLSKAIIGEAIAFLQEQLNNLSPSERKLRMQYLISMLPFTMDDQTFANYFNDGLEGTSNPIKKVYVLAKISNFMESCGYFE